MQLDMGVRLSGVLPSGKWGNLSVAGAAARLEPKEKEHLGEMTDKPPFELKLGHRGEGSFSSKSWLG